MKFFFLSLAALTLAAAGIGCGQDKKNSPAPVAPAVAAPSAPPSQNPSEDVVTEASMPNGPKSGSVSLSDPNVVVDPSESLAQQYGALAFALDKEDIALQKAIKDKNNTVQLGPEFGKALILAMGTAAFGFDGARRLGYIGKDWTSRFTRTRVTEGTEGMVEASTTEKAIEIAARPSKFVGGTEVLLATVLGIFAVGETYKWGKDSYFVVFGSTQQIRDQERKVRLARINFDKAAKDMHALAAQEVNQQQQQQQRQAPQPSN